ncbi:MAG: Nramp family divalent metal transporter [Saprospiraceae bacterium]
MTQIPDPYRLDDQQILEPPSHLLARLRHLGPGFILSAAIVGSGELIATTSLGAKAGFITFWVILVSCAVKVAVQMELAKQAILTGETAMQSLQRLPGPRIGRVRWSVTGYFYLSLIKMFQIGGIIGGVAIVLHMIFPWLSITIWVIAMAIVVALMVYRGYYGYIEKLALVLIGLFTIFTFTSLYFIQATPYAIHTGDIWSGLQFHLPANTVWYAIAAFGITGVGGEEIIYYTYWCLEKGYARYTGPRDGTPAWVDRAHGWIRVMKLDALLAMVFYTLVTAAFYLLGAAVLHQKGEIPEGFQMIETLSRMYTETVGPGAKLIFLVGAFIVLFSTLFAALAAWARQYSDIFGQYGWIDFFDVEQRRKWIARLSWIFPLVSAMLFLSIKLPVLMVMSGGIAGSLMLLIVVYAAIHFRLRRTPIEFRPSRGYDIYLIISILGILGVSAYGIIQLL